MPWATNEFQKAFTSVLSYVKVMNIPNKLGHHVPHTGSQSHAALMAISIVTATIVPGMWHSGRSVLQCIYLKLFCMGQKKKILLKVKIQC